MDSLEDFEKSLAAEKARREESERRHRKHRHHRHEDAEDRERHRRRDRDRDDEKDRDRDRDRNRERERDRDKERDRDGDSHRHRRHRERDDGNEDAKEGDRHRDKRSRRSHDHDHDHDRGHSDEERRHRHRHRNHCERESDADARREREQHVEEDSNREEKENGKGKEAKAKAPVRDAWMTDPAAFEVEHVRRPERRPSKSPTPEPPKRTIHSRELNTAHLEDLNSGKAPAAIPAEGSSRTVDYTFGDAGSAWRMTKLRAVYDTAEESGRSVEEIALQRFGSLEFFDDAREEQEEMERRRLYGEGYEGKDRPSGELYRERTKEHFRERSPSADPAPHQRNVQQQQQQPVVAPMDQTALNRLRAQMMKAKLRRAPDAAKLEEEYNRAAAAAAAGAAGAGVGSSAISAPEAVVLGAMESRLLAGPRGEITAVDTKRGRERGLVQENAEMTLDDMVREERRTKGQSGGEGLRLAERIAKDARFDADLEYMDENAEKLARRVHKSEVSLKNVAVHEFQRLNRILESCPLCHRDDQGLPPLAPVVALATRVFLTLPTDPEISPGGAVVAPLAHRRNLLECDDDEWEELRNFMKSLTRMYHDQGREVLFYENAAAPQRHLHAALIAVPIPYDQGAMAPAFFREAFLSSDEEWSQHRKVIDTAANARDGMGRMAFRRCIAKESPYFHVWFGLDGGLGHIVENADKWPRGDLFAREVIGGIVDAEPHIIKKQGRWSKADSRVDGFKKGWRKFDWTRVLTES